MSTRKRKVEDAKNGSEESALKRRTPDVPVSQPDTEEKAPVDSLSSYSVEDIWQKLKELGLPEVADKFRGKKPHLLI